MVVVILRLCAIVVLHGGGVMGVMVLWLCATVVLYGGGLAVVRW